MKTSSANLGRADESADISEQDRYSEVLGSWHASIIKVLGSQFLMYVHTKSLYSTLDLMDAPGGAGDDTNGA